MPTPESCITVKVLGFPGVCDLFCILESIHFVYILNVFIVEQGTLIITYKRAEFNTDGYLLTHDNIITKKVFKICYPRLAKRKDFTQ